MSTCACVVCVRMYLYPCIGEILDVTVGAFIDNTVTVANVLTYILTWLFWLSLWWFLQCMKNHAQLQSKVLWKIDQPIDVQEANWSTQLQLICFQQSHFAKVFNDTYEIGIYFYVWILENIYPFGFGIGPYKKAAVEVTKINLHYTAIRDCL